MAWEVKKLGDICEFQNGLWTGKKPPFIKVRVIRNTNFTKEGKLDDSNIVSLDVEKSQFASRKLQFGDIILEKSGGGPKQPVGRVIIFDKKEGDFSFSNFTSVIRIKDKKQVDFNFLHKFLFFSYVSGATEIMQSHSTGIRNLKFEDYKNISIPLPSLPEQKRIVAILDKSFESITKAKENAEKNLKNAKEIFESYLQSVFENKGEGWEIKKLGDVVDFQRGLTYSKKDEVDTSSNIVLRANNINVLTNSLDFTELKYINKSINIPRNKKVLKGSLIICTASGSKNHLGKVALIGAEYDYAFGGFMGQITPRKSIDSKFLFYVLTSEFYKKFIGKLSDGVNINNLKFNDLKEFSFPLPSLPEQKRIVSKLDALSQETKKLESIYNQKLADLEELKKSILQKAFKGELT